MQIAGHCTELHSSGRHACLAIGVFDGVHLGHQQVLHQTISHAAKHQALSVAVTFDRHPNAIVAPDRVPKLIYSLRKRLRVIESLGVDAALVIPFDPSFSKQSGDDFIRALAEGIGGIRSICVGKDFVFGHNRTGTFATLESLGKILHFAVFGLDPVSYCESLVSSTRIRELIAKGDFGTVRTMLGRDYSLAGTVVRGDGVGQQLGFPTANIEASGLVLPPSGVYAAQAKSGSVTYRAVMNIGCRPTRQKIAPEIHTEAHLLDFSGNLYGEELELTLVQKLREETKFSSLDALRSQIANDAALARSILN
ncbi:MAG: bifunctional riboflavin kinase/FAD synthetase [Verrucomicrobia bacterium]|nr:bifunctional riboflavin kinase/FAD synthetase [Verrucomicrobiota bacterium]